MRAVIGSFNVRIPVATPADILPGELDLLAVLKARLQVLPPGGVRWLPVLQRYVGLVSGRVDGLGGSASGVPPSFDGASVSGWCGPAAWCEGRVCGLAFDACGEFDGFFLKAGACGGCGGGPCCGLDRGRHHGDGARHRHREHRFYSRELGIRRLVEKAAQEGGLVCVKFYETSPMWWSSCL